jgi:hypothetical protein
VGIDAEQFYASPGTLQPEGPREALCILHFMPFSNGLLAASRVKRAAARNSSAGIDYGAAPNLEARRRQHMRLLLLPRHVVPIERMQQYLQCSSAPNCGPPRVCVNADKG